MVETVACAAAAIVGAGSVDAILGTVVGAGAGTLVYICSEGVISGSDILLL